MHGVDKTEPFFHAALLHRRLNLAGDIYEVIALLRVHPEVFGVGFHVVDSKKFMLQLSPRIFMVKWKASGEPLRLKYYFPRSCKPF